MRVAERQSAELSRIGWFFPLAHPPSTKGNTGKASVCAGRPVRRPMSSVVAAVVCGDAAPEEGPLAPVLSCSGGPGIRGTPPGAPGSWAP